MHCVLNKISNFYAMECVGALLRRLFRPFCTNTNNVHWLERVTMGEPSDVFPLKKIRR